MATTTIQDIVAGIDIAMKQLRASMRGIQIRRAGFRSDHDRLARGVANLAVTLVEAQPLLVTSDRRRRSHR